MQTPLIIGLAGTFASGKDTLAHHLVKNYDFLHISTGDMLRQEAMKTHGSIERPVLHEVGTTLRQAKGAGFLVELALQTFTAKRQERDDYKGLVVSGLRSLGEAKAIKTAGGVLVFVDAPIEVRFKRMAERKRDQETKLTLEEFAAQEANELAVEGNDDAAFNILGIKDMSDHILDNGQSLKDFLAQALGALGLL